MIPPDEHVLDPYVRRHAAVGLRAPAIARLLGRARSTIWLRMVTLGLPLRPRPQLSEMDAQQREAHFRHRGRQGRPAFGAVHDAAIAARLAEGVAPHRIAIELGVSRTWVVRRIAATGMTRPFKAPRHRPVASQLEA